MQTLSSIFLLICSTSDFQQLLMTDKHIVNINSPLIELPMRASQTIHNSSTKPVQMLLSASHEKSQSPSKADQSSIRASSRKQKMDDKVPEVGKWHRNLEDQQHKAETQTNTMLVNVRPHLTKPKELIPSSAIKHAYPEIWDTQTQGHPGNNKTPLESYASTANQARANFSTNRKDKKTTNIKYATGDESLKERAEEGEFGELVYSRFGEGEDMWKSLWKPTPALNAQQKQEKCDRSGLVEFDSKFQSGNLLQAYSYSQNSSTPTFLLILQNDTNTYGYNQWFYFKVRPRTPHIKVRFEIINMRKNYSLHRNGMKIAIFNELLFKENGKDWHRGGSNIQYTSNNINLGVGFNLHSLGWDYTLENTDSWVYFAYSYPYTYSQLKQQLSREEVRKNKGVEVFKLGLTLMKNAIYLILIKENQNLDLKNKKSDVDGLECVDDNNRNPSAQEFNISTDIIKTNKRKQKNIKNRNSSYNNNSSQVGTPLATKKFLKEGLSQIPFDQAEISVIEKREHNKSTIIQKSFDRESMTISPQMKNNNMDIRDVMISLTPFQSNDQKEHGKESQKSFEIIQGQKRKGIVKKIIKNESQSNFLNKSTNSNNEKFSMNKKINKFSKKTLPNTLNKTMGGQQKLTEKDVLLIMARAHAGQTVGSHVLNGFLQVMLTEQPEAVFLKKSLDILIVPMLNPDGVIHGNTRTSLSGNDLNRRWDNPSDRLHPQITLVKKYISKILSQSHADKKMFGMVDLHGHTGRESAFFYGCCDRTNFMKHKEVRLLNELEGELDPENFNQRYSNNYVGPGKASTARVAFFRDYSAFSYTLESSFLGAAGSLLHFSVADYQNIGKRLTRSLAMFKDALTPRINRTQLSLSLLSFLRKSNENASIAIDTLKVKEIMNNFRQWQKNIANKSRKEAMEVMLKEYEQNQVQMERLSDGSSSCPSKYNYNQQFLEQQMETEDEARILKRNQKKKDRMNKEVQRLFSIDSKKQRGVLEDEQLKAMTSRRKLSLKSGFLDSGMLRKKSPQKVQRMSFEQGKQEKLPFLPFTRKVGQQISDQLLLQTPNSANTIFQAFNFKARKVGVYKKKKSSALILDTSRKQEQ